MVVSLLSFSSQARQYVFARLSHTPFYCFSGHCKALKPEYEQAAAVLSAQDPPQTIAKIDATENKVIASRMGIDGFPTLFFFK